VKGLMGFTTFFDNFLTIVILLLAWLLVILAFFILAVQIFVTILEFKLTSLAGFILVPFALWNRTAFLAERVLGNVVSSGIKVMVLAVIVGIGSNFFDEFTSALQGQEPDIGQTLSLVLASLALFGLGIFGPSIASGLVAGAPQLGAGAALGTGVGAAGIIAVPPKWSAALRLARFAPAPAWARPRRHRGPWASLLPARRASAPASAAWRRPPAARCVKRRARLSVLARRPNAVARRRGPDLKAPRAPIAPRKPPEDLPPIPLRAGRAIFAASRTPVITVRSRCTPSRMVNAAVLPPTPTSRKRRTDR